jgi:hypothetical protein
MKIKDAIQYLGRLNQSFQEQLKEQQVDAMSLNENYQLLLFKNDDAHSLDCIYLGYYQKTQEIFHWGHGLDDLPLQSRQSIALLKHDFPYLPEMHSQRVDFNPMKVAMNVKARQNNPEHREFSEPKQLVAGVPISALLAVATLHFRGKSCVELPYGDHLHFVVVL